MSAPPVETAEATPAAADLVASVDLAEASVVAASADSETCLAVV